MGLVKSVSRDHGGRKMIIIGPSFEDLIPNTPEEISEAGRLSVANYRAFHPPKYIMNEVVGDPVRS